MRPSLSQRASIVAALWMAFCSPLLSAEPSAPVYIEDVVSLRLSAGERIDARLRVPRDQQERLPAVMLFGGIERGAAALDLIEPQVPMLMASFDYPFEVPQRADIGTIARLLPEARRAIQHTREGIGLLQQALRQRGDVDPERITVVGVSLGAPFAVMAAADHQVPGLVVIHGFAEVPDVIAHQFIRRREPPPGAVYRSGLKLLSRLMAWIAGIPDIADKAASLDAGQQVWMLAADDDELLPPSATESLRLGFEQSAAKFSFEIESGGHLAGEADPRIPQLLKRATDWMSQASLL